MATSSKIKKSNEITMLISILFGMAIAGLIIGIILGLKQMAPPKATYKCLDGIKYEVKNGNELHIQLTNNGQAFRC